LIHLSAPTQALCLDQQDSQKGLQAAVRVCHPRDLRKRPNPLLACSSGWSLVRVVSRCFAMSRGLYAAW